MKRIALALAFIAALSASAFAQWQVPANSIPLGRGPGFIGFASVAPGTNGQCLVSNGTIWRAASCGAIAGITVGSTTIASGTDTRVLFDNAGVLGEYAISGTGSVCMTTNCALVTPDLGTPTALVATNATGTAAGLTVGNATNATTATTATTATNATNSAITNDTATNASMFPTWVTANTGNLPLKVTSTKLFFNPSTGLLTSTGFSGSGANITGVPISTGVSGLGTGAATALAVNVGSAGAFVTFNGALGTPSSGTLTNATGLPISTGLTGAGTGVLTALGVNVSTAGAFVVNGGALGTPSSGTLTSATGLPISTGLTGAGTGVLTALGVNVGSVGAFITFNGAGGTPSSMTLTNATGLPVAGGGTGLATLTANNVILGNGTSAVAFVAPGTSGNVLTSNGTTWTSAAPAASLVVNTSLVSGGAAGNLLYTDGTKLQASTGITVTSGQLINAIAGAASTSPEYLTGVILTGGTGTTNFPHLFIQPSGATAGTTWSTSGTAFGINAGAAFAGNLWDIRAGGAVLSQLTSGGVINSYGFVAVTDASTGLSFGSGLFQIKQGGTIAIYGNSTRPIINTSLGFSVGFTGAADVILTDVAAATLQQGAVDAASPVAQTLRSQGSRAGTDSNVGGANYTILAGIGTGTGTTASLILQSPAAVASGTGAQTATTGLTIRNGAAVRSGYTVATLPTGVTGGMAYVSDAVACTFLATPTGGAATFCPVIYNGAAWVAD